MEVEYSKGGKVAILVPDDILHGSKLCGAGDASQWQSGESSNRGDGRLNVPVASTILFAILVLLLIR